MRFLVLIYRYEGDYSALVPDLPGCVAAGSSIEETRKLIADAIGLHLDLMQQAGEPIPVPRKQIEFIIDDAAEEELYTWVDVEVPQPVS